MKEFLVRLCKDDDGATAIEYGLIAGLIATVLITALGLLTNSLEGIFTRIATTLDAALPASP